MSVGGPCHPPRAQAPDRQRIAPPVEDQRADATRYADEPASLQLRNPNGAGIGGGRNARTPKRRERRKRHEMPTKIAWWGLLGSKGGAGWAILPSLLQFTGVEIDGAAIHWKVAGRRSTFGATSGATRRRRFKCSNTQKRNSSPVVDCGFVCVGVQPGCRRRSHRRACPRRRRSNRKLHGCFALRSKRLAADTAYGTGKFLDWLVKRQKDHTAHPRVG